jgi:hypothetical protein
VLRAQKQQHYKTLQNTTKHYKALTIAINAGKMCVRKAIVGHNGVAIKNVQGPSGNHQVHEIHAQ